MQAAHHTGLQTCSPFYRLPSVFLMVSEVQEFLVWWSPIYFLLFLPWLLVSYPKHWCLTESKRFVHTFSSKGLIVLALVFRSKTICVLGKLIKPCIYGKAEVRRHTHVSYFCLLRKPTSQGWMEAVSVHSVRTLDSKYHCPIKENRRSLKKRVTLGSERAEHRWPERTVGLRK